MLGKIKSVIFVILIILIALSAYIIANTKPENSQNEQETIAINKIVLYSSANAVNSTDNLKTDWEVDIYQYTDIAIYLQKMKDINIQKVYVDNIQITKKPSLGEAGVYSKKIEDFAKNMLLEENNEKIEFTVSLDGANDFQQNCTNPITISYINKNIKERFLIKNNDEQFVFDETILKRALILPEDIEAQLSFDINIVDTNGKQYKENVVLDIPVNELMDGEKSVEINEHRVFEEV